MSRVEDNADAREKNIDDRADQRKEAIEQRYDARREAVDAQGAPGASDSEKLLDKSQERADDQSQVQARLDKVSVQLQAAKQKISVLAEHAPTKLKTSLQTAAVEHDSLQQELVTLRSERSQTWETDKKRLEQRVSQLESRVGQLSNEINDARG
jgi:chromosome segregation ATPase